MATVLKSRQFSEGMNVASVEVFNWEDVATRARQYLDTVREHAEQVIAQAHLDAENVRKAAREEGRLAGESDVTNRATTLAQQLSQERVVQATTNIEALATQLENTTHQWLRQWQHETIPLAISIAERLVRRQLEVDPSILLQWLQDSIRLVHGSHTVEVRMHPTDIELLGKQLTDVMDRIAQQVPVKLVADDSVELRGLIIRSPETQIDQQLKIQFDRLRQELT